MSIRINRLTEKLKIKDFKLNSLLEITKAINENEPIEELLKLYESTLKDSLHIEKLVLFARYDTWKCMLKYGVEGDIADITNESFFDESDKISMSISSDGEQESFDIVVPVYHQEKPIAYLLVGDIDEDEIKVSPVIKHMNFIQTLTNIIVVAIKNKQLVEENLKQERMKKELELAAEMQAMLVPNAFPKNEYYEVSAVYKPHQQVGGDYYDFIELDDDKSMFCMADVSGKGVSAAFLMANFQANLRAIFNYQDYPLEKVIHELNDSVMQSAMGEKYITFFIATYSKSTRKLVYINCGHNPPILATENGETKLLDLGSIGLGMFEEIPNINIGRLTLPKNANVICYTDGLVELENEAQEEYSLEKLEELIVKNHHLKVFDLNNLIMKELIEYKGDMPYIDDTALLSCKFF